MFRPVDDPDHLGDLSALTPIGGAHAAATGRALRATNSTEQASSGQISAAPVSRRCRPRLRWAIKQCGQVFGVRVMRWTVRHRRGGASSPPIILTNLAQSRSMNHTDVISGPARSTKPRLAGLHRGRAIYTFRRITRDRSRRFEAHWQVSPELRAWICAYGRSRRQAVRRLLADIAATK